jgi:hypothetical protein
MVKITQKWTVNGTLQKDAHAFLCASPVQLAKCLLQWEIFKKKSCSGRLGDINGAFNTSASLVLLLSPHVFPVLYQQSSTVNRFIGNLGRMFFDIVSYCFGLSSRLAQGWHCMISSFRRQVDELCALLGYYATYSDTSLPTFRDNPSVPSSRVNKSKMEQTDFPERLLSNYHYG